ncbi:hypothetical protein [Burkholderia pseudomallei]
MDWLTFVSKVIEATAWPLAVLILVFKFSDRFRELLGNLTEFNLPGGNIGKIRSAVAKRRTSSKAIGAYFYRRRGRRIHA